MNAIEKKVNDFIEFKKAHNKAFSDYCKTHKICLKCHNPNKILKEGYTSCDECLSKMQSYYDSKKSKRQS